MAIRASCIALLVGSLAIAGCGTVANLAHPGPEQGGKTPFGGVRQDVECIKTAANGEFSSRTHAKSESEQYPQVAVMLFCAADLPLSLIGDTVTWPYTAAYSFINQPVPTPAVLLATPGDHPILFGPTYQELEKKTPTRDADQGKQGNGKPTEFPMTLPPPRKLTN